MNNFAFKINSYQYLENLRNFITENMETYFQTPQIAITIIIATTTLDLKINSFKIDQNSINLQRQAIF